MKRNLLTKWHSSWVLNCCGKKHILSEGITAESADAFAVDIAERAAFGSNMRASAEYRKKICRVLVRRALLRDKEA